MAEKISKWEDVLTNDVRKYSFLKTLATDCNFVRTRAILDYLKRVMPEEGKEAEFGERTVNRENSEISKSFQKRCKMMFNIVKNRLQYIWKGEKNMPRRKEESKATIAPFKFKNDDCLDVTNVQNDFSVIGSEFINFIVSVLTCRLIRKARNSGLMDKMTYGELMEDLDTAWRKTDAPEDPSSDDGYWVHVCNYVFDEMEALGLSKPVPKEEPRRRGRPKKHIEPADAEKPVRKRGRPRKNA